jgi:hypothetical protein
MSRGFFHAGSQTKYGKTETGITKKNIPDPIPPPEREKNFRGRTKMAIIP